VGIFIPFFIFVMMLFYFLYNMWNTTVGLKSYESSRGSRKGSAPGGGYARPARGSESDVELEARLDMSASVDRPSRFAIENGPAPWSSRGGW
jgi:hypothetical protein